MNQLHNQKIKLLDKDFAKIYWDFDTYCHNHNFVNHENISKGRLYDDGLIIQFLQSRNDILKICEIGARDSILGCYLTKEYHVCMLDDFINWPELGDYSFWSNVWKNCSFNPNNLTISRQSILQTNYCENQYDLIIALSVIDHLSMNLDLMAIKEMVRIVRPDGFCIIGVEMIDLDHSIWCRGTRYYCYQDLKTRILSCPGIIFYGNLEIDFTNINNFLEIGNKKYKWASVIFILQIKK